MNYPTIQSLEDVQIKLNKMDMLLEKFGYYLFARSRARRAIAEAIISLITNIFTKEKNKINQEKEKILQECLEKQNFLIMKLKEKHKLAEADIAKLTKTITDLIEIIRQLEEDLKKDTGN